MREIAVERQHLSNLVSLCGWSGVQVLLEGNCCGETAHAK